MKRELASARSETAHTLDPDALPQRDAVRALVAAHGDEGWSGLTDQDRFLLFEISPEARGAAPLERVAAAYCAGLRTVPYEWWGSLAAPNSATAGRLIALGAAVAPCLRPLLDAADVLLYRRGETNMRVEEHGWTLGDLAAGLAAAVLATSYDPTAPREARAARRGELARALEAMQR